jgi:hypothetical protein
MKPSRYSDIIFLDFDGVLHRGNSGTFRKLPLLDALIHELPQLGIVLSTNWRHTEDLESLQGYFSVPETEARVFDVTPILHGHSRAQRQREIEAWLAVHRGVARYVALDDSADLFEPNWRGLHLTDPREGLTVDDIAQLKRRFA